MNDFHISVLLKEAIENLKIKEEGTYVDATLGGGGHSKKIFENLVKGKLISIDQDDDALKFVKDNFYSNETGKEWVLTKGNFRDLKKILNEQGVNEIDGILYDIGVSSYQLDTKERGFAFNQASPLDMRMDKDTDLTAEQIVNEYPKEDLNRIFRELGEEKHAKRITNAILEYRKDRRITNSRQLIDIIKRSFGMNKERTVKKVFQALRVEVNQELSALALSLTQAFEMLKKDCNCCVITFQPLERKFVEIEVAKHPDLVQIEKIVEAGAIELVNNIRSKSAKMYVITKI